MRPTRIFVGIAMLLCAISAGAQKVETNDALTTANTYYDSGSLYMFGVRAQF